MRPMFTSRVPFYFIRHGLTDHNEARLLTGQLDIPLNEAGRFQAAQAAELMRGILVGKILASPMRRALETAEAISATTGIPIQVLDDLKERSWGILEGRSVRERPAREAPEGGESADDFDARVITALKSVIYNPPLLIVAHSGTCRVLRRYLRVEGSTGLVPNGVPLCFSPKPHGGGWRETRVRPRE